MAIFGWIILTGVTLYYSVTMIAITWFLLTLRAKESLLLIPLYIILGIFWYIVVTNFPFTVSVT